MVISLGKTVLRIRSHLRFYSTNLDRARSTTPLSGYPLENDIVDQSWNATSLRCEDSKSLRIAILGLPNVGKSTLINQLVCRPVCAVSSKVQTTRVKSDVVYISDNTQLVVIDTPGLVTNRDLKKFQLEHSFKTDVEKSVNTADMVGVVQDAAHPYRASVIDERVMAILKRLSPGITSILILNKVDKVKKKKKLLELVDVLTGEEGWPNFSDVFMISALQSDGVEDLRNYLLNSAKTRDWEYEKNIISNDSTETIIERTVRASFMDNLPQELPYAIKTQTEHVGILQDGSISAIVAVSCPSDRISKVVMGKKGCRVRSVALDAEQKLCQAFRTTVRLKIAIKFANCRDEETIYEEKK